MRKLLLFLPIIALIAVSCTKKDDNPDVPQPTNQKYVKNYILEGLMTFDFTYDNQNRITQIKGTYDNFPDEDVVYNITYKNNEVSVYIDDIATPYSVITLDAQGYVTKTVINDPNEPAAQTFEYKYVQGNLAKITSNAKVYTTVCWTNGNLVQIAKTSDTQPEPYDVEKFSFTDKEDKLNIGLNTRFLGVPFLTFKGLKSKNLVSRYEFDVIDYQLDYILDEDGYPTSFTGDNYPTKIIYR